MNLAAVWAIYKKEVYSYFVSPLFYVAATVFLALSGFYFHSDLAFYAQFGLGQDVLGHFWQVLFIDLRLVLMITAPLLTMRLLADERKTGSLEILYTSPITESEILLGKFASSLSVLLLLLACTLSLPAYLESISPNASATIGAGYTGLVLVGMTFLGCGILLSSLTESQTVAALGSVGLLILLWMIDWNEGVLHPGLREFVKGASMFEHFTLFANGVIDARDVAFYLFFTSLFALLTLRCMESRRWGGGQLRSGFPYLRTALEILALGVLWVVVQSGLSERVFRLDLTAEKRFSLSPRSQRILAELDRDVELVAFIENEDGRRPALEDLLHRVAAETPRIRYRIVSGNHNPALARQYDVRTRGAVVVAAEGATGTRIITDLSEPTLLQEIMRTTYEFAQQIYFVTGHGEKDILEAAPRYGYALARGLLQEELYRVEKLSLRGDEPIPPNSVVVIAGPTAEFEEGELDKLDRHVRERGVLLILLDPGGSESLADFLQRFGVEARNEVVVDPDARLTAGEPWTFRVTGRPGASVILTELQLDPVFSVSRPIHAHDVDPQLKPYVLLTSSSEGFALPWEESGRLPRETALEPKSGADRGPVPLGVQVLVDPGTERSGAPHRVGRLVVYGDSDFADNYFLGLLGNGDLLVNSVNWLAREVTARDVHSMDSALSAEQFFITAGQLRTVLWLGCFLQPGLFALMGISVFAWFKFR